MKASEYLAAIPKIAEIHIQNSAPGPPRWIAVATPAMLPTPTVAASAVDSAWKCETSPCSSLASARRKKANRRAGASLVNWTPPSRAVSQMPVPSNSGMRTNGPQMMPSIWLRISSMRVS